MPAQRRQLSRLEWDEATPTRDARPMTLTQIENALTRATNAATMEGARLVGKKGLVRLNDGRVRLYFDIQLPGEGQ